MAAQFVVGTAGLAPAHMPSECGSIEPSEPVHATEPRSAAATGRAEVAQLAVANPIAEPRCKIKEILDPTIDAELLRIPYDKVRKMFSALAVIREDGLEEDARPTWRSAHTTPRLRAQVSQLVSSARP